MKKRRNHPALRQEWCVHPKSPKNNATPSPAAEDSDPQPVTFEGSDDAASVEFSADSMTLASGNRDKTVSLWDVSTRQESARLPGHRFLAFSFAFGPDGNFLASAGDDYHMKKGEISTRSQIIVYND
jgi:WD40 repeat protein